MIASEIHHTHISPAVKAAVSTAQLHCLRLEHNWKHQLNLL